MYVYMYMYRSVVPNVSACTEREAAKDIPIVETVDSWVPHWQFSRCLKALSLASDTTI